MTTWTTLSDTTLAQDKPVTQSMVRAFRDNPIAMGENATGAPEIDPASFLNTGFFAYKSGNQALSGVFQPITYDTEAYDGSAWFNPVTGRFTPQSPGLYFIGAKVFVSAPGGVSGNFHLAQNTDVLDIYEFPSTSAPVRADLSAIMRMNGSTDYAVANWSNGSGGLTIQGGQKYYTHIFGYKVGP